MTLVCKKYYQIIKKKILVEKMYVNAYTQTDNLDFGKNSEGGEGRKILKKIKIWVKNKIVYGMFLELKIILKIKIQVIDVIQVNQIH